VSFDSQQDDRIVRFTVASFAIWTLPLWPNFVGSEDAPATAKREDEKNVFNAASIVFTGWGGKDEVLHLKDLFRMRGIRK